MKTMLVWFFVTYGANGSAVFSPAFETQAECQRVANELIEFHRGTRGRCVQMTVVVGEKK